MENEAVIQLSVVDKASENLKKVGENVKEFAEKFKDIKLGFGEGMSKSMEAMRSSFERMGGGIDKLKEGLSGLKDVGREAFKVIAVGAAAAAFSLHEAMREQYSSVGLQASVAATGGSMKQFRPVIQAIAGVSTESTPEIEQNTAYLAGMGYNAVQSEKMQKMAIGLSAMSNGTLNQVTALRGLIAAQNNDPRMLMSMLPELHKYQEIARMGRNNPEMNQFLLNKITGLAQTGMGVAVKQRDTLSGQMAVMRNRLEDVGASFGKLLLPQVTKITHVITHLAEAMEHISGPTKNLVVRIAEFVGIGAAMAFVIPKIVSGLDTMANIVYNVVGGLSQMAMGIAGVALSIGRGFMTAIVSATRVVVSLGVTILRIASTAFMTLVSVALGLARTLGGVVVGAIGAVIKSALELAMVVAGTVVGTLTEKLTSFAIKQTVDAMEGLWHWIKKVSRAFFDLAINAAKSLANVLMNVVSAAIDMVIDLAAELVAGVGELALMLPLLIPVLILLAPLAGKAFKGIADSVGAAGAAIEALVSKLGDDIGGAFKSLGGLFTAVFGGIGGFFGSLCKDMIAAFSGVVDAIKSSLGSLWPVFSSFGNLLVAMFEKIGHQLERALFSGVGKRLESLAKTFQTKNNNLHYAPTNGGSLILNNMARAANVMISVEKGMYGGMAGGLSDVGKSFSSGSSKGTQKADAANVAAAQAALSLAVKQVHFKTPAAITNMINQIKGAIGPSTPQSQAIHWIQLQVKNFGIKLPPAVSDALELMRQKGQSLSSKISESFAKVKSAIETFGHASAWESLLKSVWAAVGKDFAPSKMGDFVSGLIKRAKDSLPAIKAWVIQFAEHAFHMSKAQADAFWKKTAGMVHRITSGAAGGNLGGLTTNMTDQFQAPMSLGSAFQKQIEAFAMTGLQTEGESIPRRQLTQQEISNRYLNQLCQMAGRGGGVGFTIGHFGQ